MNRVNTRVLKHKIQETKRPGLGRVPIPCRLGLDWGTREGVMVLGRALFFFHFAHGGNKEELYYLIGWSLQTYHQMNYLMMTDF